MKGHFVLRKDKVKVTKVDEIIMRGGVEYIRNRKALFRAFNTRTNWAYYSKNRKSAIEAARREWVPCTHCNR